MSLLSSLVDFASSSAAEQDAVSSLLLSDEQITAACLEYLNLTLSSLFAESTSNSAPGPHQGLLPTPAAPVMDESAASSSLVRNGGGVMMCLASVLESLAECDEQCVFSVRKINKLGFKSHTSLKKYFSQFGTVMAIFFLPYRYKPDTSSVRPSSMAFVRMTSRHAVESIFAMGAVHYIHGWPVTVQPFTRSPNGCYPYA